jgi:hypothetical protein
MRVTAKQAYAQLWMFCFLLECTAKHCAVTSEAEAGQKACHWTGVCDGKVGRCTAVAVLLTI